MDEFVFDPDALDERGSSSSGTNCQMSSIRPPTLPPSGSGAAKEMFHFSHTMEAQLGGMTDAGFVITGFYEDRRTDEDGNPIRFYMPSDFVVRALRGTGT